MLWLVFSIPRLTYVFPGSTDENHYFPTFTFFVLPHKRDKAWNIHVSTSTLDMATIERHSMQKCRQGQRLLFCGGTLQCK
jgi:hypothetical protein